MKTCKKVQKSFHAFLTSTLNKSQLNAPAALPLRIELPISIREDARLVSEHVWKMRKGKKSITLAGNQLPVLGQINIVTCRGVHVTKLTGSRSDDWIYWHFCYKFS
jgi:hypothetical protein